METIYLPIRAFGDFTISASVIKKNCNSKIPILLPEYLVDLFNTLEGEIIFDVIDIIGLKQYHKLYELHKIRNLNDLQSLYKDIIKISQKLDKKNRYLLDHKNRRSKILTPNLVFPNSNENIYASKSKLFSSYFEDCSDYLSESEPKREIKKITIFPGSRKLSKALNYALVASIATELSSKGFSVSIAYHESEKTILENVIYFNSFNMLKKIIINVDMIIAADSLPIHFAYYFNKPHFVIYNDNDNSKWATPFIIENKTSAISMTGNNEDILKKIKKYIKISNANCNK
ncbi:MAG: hypothetical protein JSR11_12635 [Bacteroidetes bacterium]|nr:hypothetical protein [Bacteroidota bacterium]